MVVAATGLFAAALCFAGTKLLETWDYVQFLRPNPVVIGKVGAWALSWVDGAILVGYERGEQWISASGGVPSQSSALSGFVPKSSRGAYSAFFTRCSTRSSSSRVAHPIQ